MKVPANWWNSVRTRELHDGKIKSFNVLEQKWMLELDSEPDDEYGMAYDAVYAYVDEGLLTYDDYRLPADPTREEVDAEVEVRDDNNQRRYTATGPDDWESVDVENGESRMVKQEGQLSLFHGQEEQKNSLLIDFFQCLLKSSTID